MKVSYKELTKEGTGSSKTMDSKEFIPYLKNAIKNDSKWVSIAGNLYGENELSSLTDSLILNNVGANIIIGHASVGG